jgi:hypothetical protein
MSGTRRRLATTFTIGATTGAAVCALVTTGVLGGAAGLVSAVGSLTRVPTASADELPGFRDCEQLRQWYVEAALPHVGPWGYGGGPVAMFAERSDAGGVVPEDQPAQTAGDVGADAGTAGAGTAAAGDAVGSSGTGTTVQEVGVDESDVAKTDGALVVRVVGDDVVVTDVSGSRPRELSRTSLPGPRLDRPELLLRDDRVVVVGDELGPSFWGGSVEGSGRVLPSGPADSVTHLVTLDLRDPAAPRVTSHRAVDGGAVSTREYADGTVRIVVTTGLPPMDFVEPNRDRSPAAALRRNRNIVRSATIDEWLPGVRRSAAGRAPLVDCRQVRHPRRPSGFGTISVLAFPFDDPERLDTTAVAAAGDLVYSSASRLYVATTTGDVPPAWPTDTPDASVPAPSPLRTEVHAFAVDGPRTAYVASGSFDGTVKDRWSFSEYEGHLRVAASLPPTRRGIDNGVLVLDEHGDRLDEVGRVDGLGRGEDIQSVRWLGHLAIVVTFRRTDPLYSVDLSDPDTPRVVDALKIPGFSSYLHPLGDDRLLGVGHDISARTGSDLGAQAATFDLRDPGHVRRLGTYGFGPQTDTGVAMDPRTFTYLPDRRVLLVTVQDWSTGSSRVVALRVRGDGSLTLQRSWAGDADTSAARALPLGGGRVALVGDTVRVVVVP